MNSLKHLPPRPFAVRLSPPSKNSADWSLVPTPSTLLAVSHWVFIVPVMALGPELVVAQTASPPAVDLQSTPWAFGFGLSTPLAPPSHR